VFLRQRFQCRQLPPGCYLKIEASPVEWPLLRRSEPAQSCQISLALCSEWHPQQLRCEDSAVFRPYLCGRRRPLQAGLCWLRCAKGAFKHCAAQGYKAFPQHSLQFLASALLSLSFCGCSPLGPVFFQNAFWHPNYHRAFCAKGSTHRTPRLSVSTRPSLYWPKALPIAEWIALEIAPPIPQRGPCHFEAAMVF
jgi:hypothetical protein